MISASFPIIKDNQVAAVIATNLSLKPISKMVQQVMENAASNIYVLTNIKDILSDIPITDMKTIFLKSITDFTKA